MHWSWCLIVDETSGFKSIKQLISIFVTFLALVSAFYNPLSLVHFYTLLKKYLGTICKYTHPESEATAPQSFYA